MLQAIRRGSRSWFGIILAVILIPPFAVVGVDYVFQGGLTRSASVVEVGGEGITGTEFEREYRNRINTLQRRFNQPLDYQTARRLGLVERIIGQLVTRMLYQVAANTYGILVANEVVRQDILDSRAFRGVSGEFDRGVFQQVLRDAGLSESGYIEARRQELQREMLRQAVQEVGGLPKAYVDRIRAFRAQTRGAEMVVIPTDSIEQVPEPTQEQLAAFHKEHTERYTAPEYRSVNALVVRPEDVADRLKIDEKALREAYEQRKPEFTEPEKRTLVQIVVPDEEIAKQAHAALMGGRSFEAVADEIAKRPILKLGSVTKSGLPLPQLGEAAFKAGEGEVTAPIKTPLGWHILRVVEVDAASVKPFEEVSDQIRKDLVQSRAAPVITDLRNQVDDALGGGIKLSEIAKRLDLKLYQVPAVDRQGEDKSGETVDLPARETVVARAFQQKPDGYVEVVDFDKGGGFHVVQVDKVIPAAVRPLDSIREKVVEDWKAAKRGELAKARAEEIAKAVRGGTALAEAAERPVVETNALSRYDETGDERVSRALRDALFRADKTGAVVVAPTQDGWSVARLGKIETSEGGKDENGKMAETLRQAYSSELFSQFDAFLRQQFPVEVDRESIDKLFTSNRSS